MTAAPKLFTIPAGAAFLDELAAELWRRADADPLTLARATVLLPTNRAVRAVAESFLRLGEGRPMLLPSLRPLAAVEDDALEFEPEPHPAIAAALDLPPAIAGTRRQLLLTQLILTLSRTLGGEGAGGSGTPDQAARLASALARLIDEVQTQDLAFEGLRNLVPERYSAHWQQVLTFLSIVTEHWPTLLEEEGAVDPKIREFALIRAQAEAWRGQPPADPVIIAGSTGSVPATVDLMRVVAALPQGAVILPGLDQDSDDASWRAIREDDSHPQNGLARLLDQFDVDRRDVPVWGAGRLDRPRRVRLRLVREAMRPAATTEAWRRLSETAPDLLGGDAFDGITRIDAATPREEAGAIAVALREVAETPGKTAALITADRALARRVRLELSRWGLTVDDSGGSPLVQAPVATFLELLAETAADRLAPVPLLALLKHPLTAAGFGAAEARTRIGLLDYHLLHGPRPGPGTDGLRDRLAALTRLAEAEGRAPPDGRIEGLIDALETRLGAFLALMGEPAVAPAELLGAQVAAAEALAESEQESGADRLWRGEAGEMLAGLVADLREGLAVLPAMPGRQWPSLFRTLLEGRVVRPRERSHPRLQILGALEARLQRFDRVILGGLIEGSWPREPEPDPWMGRPMRAAFGLPPHERRIGLSAHDFAMAMTASEVFLTRSTRVEGTPTVASRWWRRLETVDRAIHHQAPRFVDDPRWIAWHAGLDRPETVERPGPPTPKPPLEARPTRLSVTEIQTWLENPYAIYAKHVLGLRMLDPVDQEPGAQDRGTAIHDALEAFCRRHPKGPLPPDALDQLIACGRETFDALMAEPVVRAFWWPRFERVAAWFVAVESRRRALLAETLVELQGVVTLEGGGRPFTLRGRADRIDRLAEGGYAIIDYKTGLNPTLGELKSGAAPQLPLEAMMIRRHGYSEVDPAEIRELAYWRLRGGEEPGRIDAVGGDLGSLIAEAEAGLLTLIREFENPDTPYHPRPDPRRAPKFDDYADLARVLEWGRGPEGDADG